MYADIWKDIKLDDNSIPKQWELLVPVFTRYKRPFTFLDIGENNGYFGIRTANDFDAISIIIDKTAGVAPDVTQPKKICCARDSVSLSVLEGMAKTEHFDVAIISHIYFGELWEKFINVAMNLGDFILFSYPKNSKYAEYFEGMYYQEILGEVNNNLTCLFHKTKTTLNGIGFRFGRSVPKDEPKTNIEIKSSYITKTIDKITKAGKITLPWVHGINLNTFLAIGGMYPTRKMIIKMIMACGLPDKHGDITPWNYILDGQKVQLIDFDGTPRCDDELAVIDTMRFVYKHKEPFLL